MMIDKMKFQKRLINMSSAPTQILLGHDYTDGNTTHEIMSKTSDNNAYKAEIDASENCTKKNCAQVKLINQKILLI